MKHDLNDEDVKRLQESVSEVTASFDRMTAAVLTVADMISKGKITLTWETKTQ